MKQEGNSNVDYSLHKSQVVFFIIVHALKGKGVVLPMVPRVHESLGGTGLYCILEFSPTPPPPNWIWTEGKKTRQ